MLISLTSVATSDVENLRYWYMRYFAMSSTDRHTDNKGRNSYILSCPEGDCRLLIDTAIEGDAPGQYRVGISVGSREGVDFLTELLRTDGNPIVIEPSTDVYGAYRAVVLDPDGNRVSVRE